MQERFPEGYFQSVNLDKVTNIDLKKLQSRRSYKRLLCKFILELPPKARVLDAGCGQGKTARIIRALRPDVAISAIDMSDTKRYLPGDIEFVQGSVEELETMYAKESFDAVICQHVLEHLLYPSALTGGIYEILKKGGRVFFETPNWTRLFVPFSHLFFWADYTHVHPFSRRTMHRLLEEYGFHILSNRTISTSNWDFTIHGNSNSKITGPITRTGLSPFPSNIPARILSRIINPMLRDVLIAVAEKK